MAKTVPVPANTVVNVNLGSGFATGTAMSVFNEGMKNKNPSFHGCQIKFATSQPTADQMLVDATFLPDYRFGEASIIDIDIGSDTVWAYFSGDTAAGDQIILSVEAL